jgi:hypothetical protein
MHAGVNPLLPRLRILEFLEPGYRAFLPLFLASDLVTLSVTFNYEAQNFSLIRSLNRQPLRHLQRFTVLHADHEDVTDPYVSSCISDILCNTPHLWQLTCEVNLTTNALLHICTSKTITDLRLTADVVVLHHCLAGSDLLLNPNTSRFVPGNCCRYLPSSNTFTQTAWVHLSSDT